MARLRRIKNTSADDEAALQLNWARFVARVGNIAARDSRDHYEDAAYYMGLSADELRELIAADPDHPAAKRCGYHLSLAEQASR